MTPGNKIKILVAAAIMTLTFAVNAQRKITPVKPTTTTSAAADQQKKKEADPRENLAEMKDAEGNIIFIDTISGKEWVDTTARKGSTKMIYPLMESVTVGLNVWDPLMRLFGQHYGGADIWGELSLHNRYKPVFEFGLSSCNDTPDGQNYTFKSPLAPYFKIGANYNIFYNNNPHYQALVGVRYGFTPFRYEVSNFTLDDSYWGEQQQLSIPSQSATAGYFEFLAGVRVMIGKGISVGWNVKYHALLHESKGEYGKSMYIPGYGKRGGSFTASLSVSYTLPLPNKEKTQEPVTDEE